MTVKAFLSARRDKFTLTTGLWSGTFPVEKLEDWINTFESMGANRLKMRLSYDPSKQWACADELRRLQGKLGVPVTTTPPRPRLGGQATVK